MAEPVKPAPTPTVSLRCISDRRPWVDDRPCATGDVVQVEKALADTLVQGGLFVPHRA